ncbi:MAG: tRNA(Met) cytidine acetyltransferase TmcA [Salinirussus sp.]
MDAAAALRREARRANERRLLVLTGTPAETRHAATVALEAAGIDGAETVSIGAAATLPGTRLTHDESRQLLGGTYEAVVIDAHDACRPNTIGRAAGAVNGGGLLILLTPRLDEWPDRTDAFDDTLAVPPSSSADVTSHFRRRLVRTLRQHPGVAIIAVDASEHRIVRDGLMDPTPTTTPGHPSIPEDRGFPRAVYEACRTHDQLHAVAVIEDLPPTESIAVLESDRGRGKSSAAGLAAAGHALAGLDVLITAPARENAGECLARAREILTDRDALVAVDEPDQPTRLETADGVVRFEPSRTAVKLSQEPDLVIVDEAAGLPVSTLEELLAAPAIVYATTIHGYEGTGRGFSVRFRGRLERADRPVLDVRLDEPIRYAPGDPVEIWSFRALALDAEPAPDDAVSGMDLSDATYTALSPTTLSEEEALLRETFGLLVLAHYRTEPDDLARLLDAPNVAVRALTAGDRVLSVALLAREGGLDANTRATMYEGGRVRGNMIPDVLTSQLRDESAAVPIGQRILRIATHPALRSRGLGSRLLDEIRAEFAPNIDWLGVGYGAVPELVEFWRTNGFRTVHFSTTRNQRSGEHSAIMLSPTSAAGETLLERHTAWLLRRLPGNLVDTLSDVDPDIVRSVLGSIAEVPDLDLSQMEWRVAAGLPHGAAIHDTAPRAVAQLTLRHLVAPEQNVLTPRQERLLVIRALQARPWSVAKERLAYESHAACMRALADAAGALVQAYGDDTAMRELTRFE